MQTDTRQGPVEGLGLVQGPPIFIATEEQLRLRAIELQMAAIRSAVHILFPDYLAAGSRTSDSRFLGHARCR
jgi:hypothetical protein